MLGNDYGFGFMGLRFVETERVGEPFEDWSQVRSPSRALRRRRLGHPQRIVTRYKPTGKVLQDKANGVVYIHPLDALRLEGEMRETSHAAGA